VVKRVNGKNTDNVNELGKVHDKIMLAFLDDRYVDGVISQPLSITLGVAFWIYIYFLSELYSYKL
jgi:hypothetical protein